MTHSNSDDWLENDPRPGERRCVVRGLVYYTVWTDHDGQPVGVTVDYEYADDVHFSLSYASWLAFLKSEGVVGTGEPRPRRLEYVLGRDDSYSEFEGLLVQLQLPYKKRVFWDGERAFRGLL